MKKVVCIGGGPAGLTAAYMLAKEGVGVAVLEADTQYVGGISRTIQKTGAYGNFCFDIGGHRFFSKSAEVVALWKEILGDDLIVRSRKSRIYYGGKFYPYPLNLVKTISNLGLLESALCGASYVYARVFPCRDPKTFEQWVSNQFGTRLFRMFFKTYTEKVWGMSCSEISADWAAQRIKGLSLAVALKNALASALGIKNRGQVKTLIESFLYPRKGPGMMWEVARDKIIAMGGSVELGCRVAGLSLDGAGLWNVEYENSQTGQRNVIQAEHVISSMPLRELVQATAGHTPEALSAAGALRYRDFLLVALVLKESGKGFDDNWLYIHDPRVMVGRIQNFKTWSPEMVPTDGILCYGMEYFCNEGDGLWASADDVLIERAKSELCQMGLAKREDIMEGYVVRQPKAYPVYDQEYHEHVHVIRGWLAVHCPNLRVVGRNGMHKYNNQDHSMMTAMLAAKNIIAGQEIFDVWHVNQDAQYHEEGSSGASGERLVPRKLQG